MLLLFTSTSKASVPFFRLFYSWTEQQFETASAYAYNALKKQDLDASERLPSYQSAKWQNRVLAETDLCNNYPALFEPDHLRVITERKP